MRVQNGTSLAAKSDASASFSTIINAPATRGLIEKTLGDPARATRLVATLVAAVADSDNLKKCKPETIISCALKGEANKLNLSLQQYYLVPYGSVCTYITGIKGYIQLAIRTGEYEELDAIDVREGEYKGRDNLTGKPKLEFISDEATREQLPVVGYYAFFKLKSGFYKGTYWTMEKVLKHADRYSRAFDMEIYKKYLAKKPLTQDEQRQVNNGPWYTSTETMCLKTVLKSLLNSGYAPLSAELIQAMEDDDDDKGKNTTTPPIFGQAQSYEATEGVNDDIPTLEPVEEEPAQPEAPKKATRKQPTPVDIQADFFGGSAE